MLAILSFVVASSTLTGQQILDRATAVWEQRSIPAYEAFTLPCHELVRSGAGGTCGNSTQMRVFIRTSDGMAHVETIPVNGGAPVVLEPVGRIYGPAYAPLGFTRKLGTKARVGSLAADPLSDIKTIASVSVANPAYDIDVTDGTCGTAAAYQLALTPRVDPATHPLRALWVDRASFEICKLTYALAFNGGEATVDYDFADLGNPPVPTIVKIEAKVPERSLIGHYYVKNSEDLVDIAFPTSVSGLP
jgi:hypothetical protein